MISEEVEEFEAAFDGEFDRLTDRQVAAVTGLRRALLATVWERDLALRALAFEAEEAARAYIREALRSAMDRGAE